MAYANKLTKNEIIQMVKEENSKGKHGIFINTDGIRYDLDGKGMAEYLESIGFTILEYKDIRTNGIVITGEGIKVSTNGFCSIIR